MRKEIIARFPSNFERYIEVFGGAAWVLFNKKPTPFEVYNDTNLDLVNLFRAVREQPDQLIDHLRFIINAKIDFDFVINLIKEPIKEPVEKGDVVRAAHFYQIIKQSYGSNGKSFGCIPNNIWNSFPIIYQAAKRLQSVIIEYRDFEKLIGKYDRPESFFYCDPPYFGTENYYRNVEFTAEDHERLAHCLAGVEGKFLLSYNAAPEIIDLYKQIPGTYIESLTRLNSLLLRYEQGAVYEEILISNFDTTRNKNQMLLWESDDIEAELRTERSFIWKPPKESK